MKKPLAAGVSKKSPKAGPVDAKGAYTKVQERTLGNMKKGGKIKKAKLGITEGPGPKKKKPVGMTMKELKMKYPDADTGKAGDVRGSEINSGAPKKVLEKYNDTYNAFERKFGNKPAKNKKGGVVKKASMKMGSKMMSKMSKKK